MQAVGAKTIEDYCNRCQKKSKNRQRQKGFYVRPRYSPGYGDLSLTYQAEFLRVLEATKKIGIVLSEGGVMIPEKSVTAVMGLSREQTRCHIEGCESCRNKKLCIQTARLRGNYDDQRRNRKKRILFFDGGMGTLLQEQGLQAGELPETWNLKNPEPIIQIHKAYLASRGRHHIGEHFWRQPL